MTTYKHTDIQTERKFNEIIRKLRERFVIFGAQIYVYGSNSDVYTVSIVKEADGYAHYFKFSKKWFDESDSDAIFNFLEQLMKEAGYHEYGNNKIPFVFFEVEHRIIGEKKIRCEECPAYMNVDGENKCWYVANPGMGAKPETECAYGITKASKDPHIGYTLKFE